MIQHPYTNKMKTIHLLVRLSIIICLTVTTKLVIAQSTDFYSLEEAYKSPESVKVLIINLNYQTLKALPEDFDKLKNLEELIFIPSFQSKNGATVYPPLDALPSSAFNGNDSTFNGLAKLPETLSNLRKLKRLVLQNNPITALPNTFSGLQSLEELHLELTAIDFDKEFDKLIALPKLKILSIVYCQASDSKVAEFRKLRPEVELIHDLEDAKEFERKNNKKHKEVLLELQFHDVYYILYVDDKDSERFVKSLPEDLQRQVEAAIQKRNKGRRKK